MASAALLLIDPIFQNPVPLFEIVVRVTIVYLGIVVLVRSAGKREVGQLAPLDLLAMLLLSETVSPALTAQDTSVSGALVAAATLIGLTALMGRLAYHFPRVERFMEGRPIVVAQDGRLLEPACRAERITRQELESAMRCNGVGSLDEVRLATVEPDGSISVLSTKR